MASESQKATIRELSATLDKTLELAEKPLITSALAERYGDTSRWLVVGRKGNLVTTAEMHKALPYPHSETYVKLARHRLRNDAYYTQVFFGIRCAFDIETGLYKPAAMIPREVFYESEE